MEPGGESPPTMTSAGSKAMANIQVIKRCDYSPGYSPQDFKIEDERGWCKFSIWPVGHYYNSVEPYHNRRLGSYGGSLWPFAWPDIFEKHFDGFGHCTGYSLNKSVADQILINA